MVFALGMKKRVVHGILEAREHRVGHEFVPEPCSARVSSRGPRWYEVSGEMVEWFLRGRRFRSGLGQHPVLSGFRTQFLEPILDGDAQRQMIQQATPPDGARVHRAGLQYADAAC